MILQRVHVAAAVLFVAAIVLQVFLAGSAIANLGGSGSFSTHVEFGYTGIGALHPVNALLLFAVSAWYARRAWQAAMG